MSITLTTVNGSTHDHMESVADAITYEAPVKVNAPKRGLLPAPKHLHVICGECGEAHIR